MALRAVTFQGPLTTIALEQGDLIYIPRGFIHAAECEAEYSLHVALGLVPFFLEDLLHATLRAAIQSDDSLRRALPLRFMNGGPETLVKGIEGALQKCNDEAFLASVVELYRDELIQSFHLDISGQIVGVFQSAPLKNEDVVGPRKGVVYRSWFRG